VGDGQDDRYRFGSDGDPRASCEELAEMSGRCRIIEERADECRVQDSLEALSRFDETPAGSREGCLAARVRSTTHSRARTADIFN
jgi:hypothetical protein